MIIYDDHRWSSWMIIIYDDRKWWSHMMIIYGHLMWWSFMSITYDDHIYIYIMMMVIYDDHIWWLFMMITYDHNISSLVMIIYDDTIWSSHMISIYDHRIRSWTHVCVVFMVVFGCGVCSCSCLGSLEQVLCSITVQAERMLVFGQRCSLPALVGAVASQV